jgi:hypothetical protein
MENSGSSRKWGLNAALALVLVIRVLFLNQAIQGDDHIYLTEAMHALVDPAHPSEVKYVFLGDEVDLRGHSHPPGNAWPLAGLLLLAGDVKEAPFHAAYILFSWLAVWAMWRLARRFSERPLWATLLFVAVPTFIVNGGSLEADLPFLAFWMASIALFVERRWVWAALAMIAATMMAYQGIFLTPILAVYVWLHHRRERARWALLLVPVAVFIEWQVFTRLTTGAMPVGKLAGYFATYGFQALRNKAASALMLFIHSWWIVFPALVPGAALGAWRRRKEPDTLFLLAWIGLFFAGAVVVFFSGSARYLLPMAAPVCLLVSRLRVKWLAPGFAVQLAVGLLLAVVNYQHWDGYRTFAAELRAPTAGHRVWVDNDWGLRYYVESDHGLAARKGQTVRAGDIIVSSELGHNVEFTAPLSLVASAVIDPEIPLRLIGLETYSGYSTVEEGYLPFGMEGGVIDRVTARMVMERHPALEYVTIGTAQAAEQIVSGVFPSDRWMSLAAVVILKTPATPKRLRAEFYIPPNAKARRVTLLLDGREVASQAYAAPGPYTLETGAAMQGSSVEVRVDQTFTAPGDQRQLGMILMGVGFAQQ